MPTAAGTTPRPSRSPVPWLAGLALLLAVACPLVTLGVWIDEGTFEGLGTALGVGAAAAVAAVLAGTLALLLGLQRGVRRVRTVVTGHPLGRAGRLADHRAARWTVAVRRLDELSAAYAAFESDPRAVAARPDLVDIRVPATARFVQAYADARFLHSEQEPHGPRREEFAAAVDRAVAAWEQARDDTARHDDGGRPRIGTDHRRELLRR